MQLKLAFPPNQQTTDYTVAIYCYINTEQSALLGCSGFTQLHELYNYNNDCSTVLKVSVSATSIRCIGSMFQSLIVLEK